MVELKQTVLIFGGYPSLFSAATHNWTIHPTDMELTTAQSTRPPVILSAVDRQRLEEVRDHPQSPPEHASHWTLKALAHETDVAMSSVRTILRRHRLYPHRVSTFKVSHDPAFAPKIHDVVGLYVNPPDHAVVLSVDEKPQIQALGRTQKPLPMTPGHTATRTHDYVRHSTTGLLTALDVATGQVTGRMTERHRSEDFVAFLDPVAEGLDADRDVHVILGNVSSHKSATVMDWLADHPRWHFHFTPTSASWAHAVEGFFSKLARQRLKHAIFNSLAECVAAVEGFIAHHNEHQARPFRWSKSPEDWVRS